MLVVEMKLVGMEFALVLGVTGDAGLSDDFDKNDGGNGSFSSCWQQGSDLHRAIPRAS